ncbi:putative heat shock protein beta-11 [Blattamonas nauphoetae]|uniref:Heat shock protein beta-11 n=1 Tax=Blattamonas nauphoetae TaxID=2049346 RepID=A0ABQ9Y9P3_9EUKA|nr:putative heat shock protein beta-11 [Blattamonas nauphoetae]
MSTDLALQSNKSNITFCSSNHSQFPADAMIDGDDKTFWISTGLFPQIVRLTFPNTVQCRQIQFLSTNIKSFSILSISKDNEQTVIFQDSLKQTPSQLQRFSQDLNVTMNELEIQVDSGHDAFISIHHLRVF